MKSALIHGALLALMLVYGYRTWTTERVPEPTAGTIVLWDKKEADLTAMEYKSETPNLTRTVRVERRPDAAGGPAYLWGNEISVSKRPKAVQPPPPPVPPVAPGSGSAAPAPTPPPPPEMEEVTTKQQFPVGESADKLAKAVSAARALRDLGPVTDANKKDYKLDESKATLTLTFGSDVKTFAIGGSVYGGTDRYAMDNATKRGYVLSKDLISALDSGAGSLRLADPRGFDANKLNAVTITAPAKTGSAATVAEQTRIAEKITTKVEGTSAKTWGDPKTGKADGTLANFIDNAGSLRPTEYQPDTKISDLTLVVSFAYRDEKAAALGTMALYKRTRAADPVPAPTAPLADPTKPAPGAPVAGTTVTEYFIVTPKTRVPGLVSTPMAEKTETDLATILTP
jgi:hypothetical protein